MVKQINERELIIQLYTFYGPLLTESQQKIFVLYYFDDYSLAEIADLNNNSRNAISLSLKASREKLKNYDLKLNLMKKYDDTIKLLAEYKIEENIIEKI